MRSHRLPVVGSLACVLLSAGACSSPSRAPEGDVVEVERIDLTPPAPPAPATEELVLPGAPPQPDPAPRRPAAE